MKAAVTWQNSKWEIDLEKPLSIAIPLKNGDQNPNCYFSDPVEFKAITNGDFIGSVKQGGSVNHKKIIISPHGNGTHTECYGHITNTDAVIANQVRDYMHVAQLITISPVVQGRDHVISESLLEKIDLYPGIKALVIRTKPNTNSKQTMNYSGTNPPYLSGQAMQLIVDRGIEHLIVDLPSVDKEQDDGKLVAHKTFWQTENAIRKKSTITELAYIPDSIADGVYLLNLQVLPIHLDVSPSNPQLFALIQL